MVRRLKADVLQQLPAKRRQRVRLEVSDAALKPVLKVMEELKGVTDNIDSLVDGMGAPDDGASGLRQERRLLVTKAFHMTGIAKAAAAAEYGVRLVRELWHAVPQ